MFLIFLAVAGIFTVFFSSAYFLYRSYFARGSNFFSYSAKIAGFQEGAAAGEELPGDEFADGVTELSITGSGGVTLKADYYRSLSCNANASESLENRDVDGKCDNAAGNGKLVVIVPGYGDSIKTVYAPAADYLRHGFDVIIVYPRGIGKSGGKRCGLSYVDATDLVRWLKYISGRFEAQKIVLHGFSFGASAVIQSVSSRTFYKARLDEYVSAVIADSAFTSMADVFSDYYKNFTKKSRFQRFFFIQLSHYMSLISFLSGCHFFENISPLKFLKRRGHLFAKSKKIKMRVIPMLFLHGKNDTICRVWMAEKLFASSHTAENRNRIVLFDDAVHGGSYYINPKKYMETVLSL